MSHTVKINLIADQEIWLLGDVVNIHDIRSIELDRHGRIIGFSKSTQIYIRITDANGNDLLGGPSPNPGAGGGCGGEGGDAL